MCGFSGKQTLNHGLEHKCLCGRCRKCRSDPRKGQCVIKPVESRVNSLGKTQHKTYDSEFSHPKVEGTEIFNTNSLVSLVEDCSLESAPGHFQLDLYLGRMTFLDSGEKKKKSLQAERSRYWQLAMCWSPLKGHRELGVAVTASATPGWQGSQEQKQGDLFARICLWPLGS